LNLSFDAKLDICTYLIWNSVKWKYWNDPCCKNEILAYMPTSLINGKFELVPRCKHDIWTYLVLYSVKWKYWNDPCRENEILVYMPTRLINGKFELVPCCETWYVNLFGFEFRKMKVLKWLCRESIWFCIR